VIQRNQEVSGRTLSVQTVIQQPSPAKKYKTTVSQPMNVGSPMPGDQLNVAMSANPLP
jgi:hypothetical protein